MALSLVPQALATGNACGNNCIETNFHYTSTTYNTNVYWTNNLYFPTSPPKLVSFTGQYVNLTSDAEGAVTNPTQGFAIFPVYGNPTINVIAADHVELTIAFTGGTSAKVSYQYWQPAVSYPSINVPSQVNYQTSTSGVTSILGTAYVTTAAAFASCAAPCVYNVSANKTLIIRGSSIGADSPLTLDIWYPLAPGGGTPTINPVVTTTSKSSTTAIVPISTGGGVETSTSTTTTATNLPQQFQQAVVTPTVNWLQNNGVWVTVVIIILVFAFAFLFPSKRKPGTQKDATSLYARNTKDKK